MSIPPAQLSYTPDINKDLTDARYFHNHSRTLQTNFTYSRVIKVKNDDGLIKKYGILDNHDNNDLIDLEAYEKLGRIKVVGYLKDKKLHLFT